MAGYNANTNWDNEEKYLNNLIAQGGGNGEWAKQQMQVLNDAKAQYSTPAATTEKVTPFRETINSMFDSSGGSQSGVATGSRTSKSSYGTDYGSMYGQMNEQQLRSAAAQNSQNWYGASKSQQDELHRQNEYINQLLDARNGTTTTYDSRTGTWTTKARDTGYYNPAVYQSGDPAYRGMDAYNGLVYNAKTGQMVNASNGVPLTQSYLLRDWANDQTDWAAGALSAQSEEEIKTLLDGRSRKAAAQGIDISGADPRYQSNEEIYQQWWNTRGKYIGNKFGSWDGSDAFGYYGEDENGDHGYYADPERTIKLANGNWGKNPNGGESRRTTGGYGLSSTGGYGGGGYGYDLDYGGYSGYGYGYGGAPTYYDAYADAIGRLTQQLLSRDPFSYDVDKDPLYGYYADAFERNGERAMKDTLGQLAARTGGMASSYAGALAQQSYNNYMSGLNDVVPELYQLAYSMWEDDEDYQRKNLDLLQNLQQGDYSKYLDALSQWNTDRNFNYGAYRDSVSDQRYADDVAYQRYRDAILDQRYADETAYSRAQYGDETAYSRLMSLAQLGGQYGDFGYLNQLGINPNLQAAAISGSTGTRSGGSSGSGSRSSSGGTTSGSAGGDAGKWADVEAYVAIGGDADDYINANYKSLGYSSQSAARSAWKVYQTQSAASSASVPSNSTPYNATTNPLTSVYYDEDEGIFTWNGKNYSSAEAFSTDLNKYVSRGIVTPAIEAEIKKKLALFGFDA